jgi:hypothetical protein
MGGDLMATERVSIIIVMCQNLFSRHHGESKEEGKKKVRILMAIETFLITIRGELKEEKKEMGGGFDGDQKGFNSHYRMAT